jgi:PAS domain S-box-containing protein
MVTAYDIGKRDSIEQQLHDTAIRLDTLIHSVHGMFFQAVYQSDGMKRLVRVFGADTLTGIPADEICRLTPVQFRQHHHPDDWRQEFQEAVRQLRDHGFSERRCRVFDQGGGLRWLHLREKVVSSDADRLVVEGLAIDITEEMVVRKELEDSEQLHRTLVTMTALGFAKFDADGKCVYVNDRLVGLTGLSRQRFLEGGWADAVHPDERQQARTAMRRAIRDGTPYREELRVVNSKDGTVKWVLSQAIPQTVAGGAVVAWAAIVTDITDHKLHEIALERVNRVLKTLNQGNEVLVRASDEDELFARMCQVIVETGGYRMAWVGLPEANDARTVRPVAHAGFEEGFLSLSPITWNDELWGDGPTGLAIRTGLPQVVDDTYITTAVAAPWRGPAVNRGYRSAIALPLRNGAGVFGCLTIYSMNPNAFTADETALFVDLANDLAYGVSAIRERRRRQEIERQLQQSQKLEALGQLAGSIAHDFNNLLGAILGFARFIAEDCGPDQPARLYAQRILSAARRGKALTGQILSFARRREMRRELVLLADLVDETQALLAGTLPSTTRIVVDGLETQAVVEGDPDQLSQLLLNLVINAHDAFGGRPGTVSVLMRQTVIESAILARLRRRQDTGTLADIEVWQDQAGNARAISGVFDAAQAHVSLVVTDDGLGMDTALLEQAFTPFFTTKTAGHGTGLGLAVVHGIVVAHGGALMVTSRLRTGTTFEVVVPCVPAPPLTRTRDDTPRQSSLPARGRVLVVDDDPDFGDMLVIGLERRGFEVSPCLDPLQAVAGIREHPDAWDVVVTDQTMPEMTGLDLIRQITALSPELPCILCTGFAEDHLDDLRSRPAGIFALLHKPVEIDQLVDILTRAVGQRRRG